MTPEELQRTIDFLLQHQAQFASQMDQIKLQTEQFKLQIKLQTEQFRLQIDQLNASNARISELLVRITELAEYQSGRLDWCEQRSEEHRLWLQKHQEWLEGLSGRA